MTSGIGTVRRGVKEGVLYLMVVNLPSESEVEEVRMAGLAGDEAA